jgi:class 3 adenylate cyclase/tetratricopeptide (TPR) repeat protein
MVICSVCGTANEAGRKFCGECAARLNPPCPICGTSNAPGTKFCGECATPLTDTRTVAPVVGARAASSAPVLRPSVVASSHAGVAERRLVSILFADLVGFTPFAAERDAEDVREMLSRYFELASEVITRHGGTVEKFIGDAVMAVWGAPVAREDDAELAVRAGLELVDAVRTLGPAIQARAGVLTGEAAVTIGATNQGMVAGDLVNTAARLQSVALPGTVLVGEPTMRAASAAIVFQEAGEQALKGKVAPVPAWRALRVVAETGGRNRSESLEAPFVGRDDEMRQLKDLFHGSARERRVRLVSVVGPAGIGKSRLAWEFLKYLDGVVDTIWWHQGRSPSYGQGISFWALGEMVRGRAGLAETDDERTTRAKVAEAVALHVPDAEERRWIEPALLALLGHDTGAGSDQLFAAWRTFFERLATTAPVVMVFEDLHWADAGTLDFIDHLLEWTRGLPIFVLTLARPELLERRPNRGAGKRSFTSVYLEPLQEAEVRALLAGLVPGLPEGAVRAIVARADGMPLYAVETVRMLLAEGRLALDGGAYRIVGDLTGLAVPETLTALIAARLDALEPDDRALLQDAAVLGQSFTLAGLAAVSGAEEAGLEPRLRALVRRELLTFDADPRSPERGQYGFVQALIREVTYNTLARRDRKLRHLAAARYFEGLGTDELVGALAEHYLAAHANSAEGPEADALAAQARIALRASADRAAALGSHEQAVAFLKGALSVTSDPVEEADLCEQAGASASAAAMHAEAERLLRRALELHEARGDRAATLRVTAELARALLTGRQLAAGFALLEPAATTFADLGTDPGFIALGGQLARAYFFRDEFRRAIEQADQTLEAAEHLDLGDVIADTLVTRGSALCSLGRFREGIGTIKIGGELAEMLGQDATLMRALNNQFVNQMEQDPRAAMEVGRHALSVARRVGARGMAVGVISGLASVSLRVGTGWDEWRAQLEALLEEDLEQPERWTVLNGLIGLLAAQGLPVDELLGEMERMAPDRKDLQGVSQLVDLRANVAYLLGRPGDARPVFLESHRMSPYPASVLSAARCALWLRDADALQADLALFDSTGAHGPALDVGRATLAHGLEGLQGRSAEAIAGYRDVLRSWRTAGLPWDEAITAIDMATVLDPADPVVADAAAAARETLTELRARPFLERLDREMARAVEAAGSPPARAQGGAASATRPASLGR